MTARKTFIKSSPPMMIPLTTNGSFLSHFFALVVHVKYSNNVVSWFGAVFCRCSIRDLDLIHGRADANDQVQKWSEGQYNLRSSSKELFVHFPFLHMLCCLIIIIILLASNIQEHQHVNKRRQGSTQSIQYMHS